MLFKECSVESLIKYLRKCVEARKDERLPLFIPVVVFLGAVGAIAGAAVTFHVQVLPALLGALGGVLLLSSGYLLWLGVLPDRAYEALNIRGKYSPRTRRWISAVALVLWYFAMTSAIKTVPSGVLGALNITVLLTLWRLITLTPAEREELNARVAAGATVQDETADDSDQAAVGEEDLYEADADDDDGYEYEDEGDK